eukprot:PhM_4_TR7919/c0_g1_i1/m.102241
MVLTPQYRKRFIIILCLSVSAGALVGFSTWYSGTNNNSVAVAVLAGLGTLQFVLLVSLIVTLRRHIFIIRRRTDADGAKGSGSAGGGGASSNFAPGTGGMGMTDSTDDMNQFSNFMNVLSPSRDTHSARTADSSQYSQKSNNSVLSGGYGVSEEMSTVAHEVRTALTGILGVVPMIRDTHMSAIQSECVDLIEMSGNHLMTFVNSILDRAKMAAGGLELDSSLVDVAKEAETAVMICAPSARMKGLDLSVYSHPDMPRITTDAVRLRQVVINLIHNALKFTTDGFVSVRCACDRGGTIMISVADSGPGMPDDQVQRLFNPSSKFQSSEHQKHHGGSGLGMVLSKSMVDILGGTIEVYSVLGEGSTFTIRLPTGQAPVETPQTTPEPLGPLRAPTTPHGRERVVVVLMQHLSSDASAELADPHLNSSEYVVVNTLKDAEVPYVRPECISELLEMAASLIRLVLVSIEVAQDVEMYRWLNALDCLKVVLCPRSGMIDHPDVLIYPVLPSTIWACLKGAAQLGPHPIPSSPMLLTSARSASSSSSASSILTGPLIRALVAEDNFVSRRVLSNLFTYLRVSSVVAENGRQAYDLYMAATQRNESFDIIFLDVEMPFLSGPEVASRIRQYEAHEKLSAVPIIALSGHDVQSCQNLFGTTLSAALTKPITRETLVPILEDYTLYNGMFSSVSSLRSFRRESTIRRESTQSGDRNSSSRASRDRTQSVVLLNEVPTGFGDWVTSSALGSPSIASLGTPSHMAVSVAVPSTPHTSATSPSSATGFHHTTTTHISTSHISFAAQV